eukprot:790778_1
MHWYGRSPPATLFGTIRNKLRGIDFVAQLVGTTQSWSDNPAIAAQISHCKKRNASSVCDTLPITASMVRQIFEWILREKVYKDLKLSFWEQTMARRYHAFPKIWNDEKRWYYYVLAIGILVSATLGLRGAEQFPSNNKDYIHYGLKQHQITFYKWNNLYNRLEAVPEITCNDADLHHARICLLNQKVGAIDTKVYLRMGTTDDVIDPVVLLYRMMYVQKKYKRMKTPFVFDTDAQRMFLSPMKQQWKEMMQQMSWYEPERMRFHGLRKGFATTLQNMGIPLSLISFAGRWKLQAAIFRYLLHRQEDMIPLAKAYWCGVQKSALPLDIDKQEMDLMAHLPANIDKALKQIQSFLEQRSIELKSKTVVIKTVASMPSSVQL